MDDLMPCPFCSDIPKTENHDGYGWYVECKSNDCTMVVKTDGTFINEKDAIENWNWRH